MSTDIGIHVANFSNEKGRPDFCDFYYLTKSGLAAEVQRIAAIKRMKKQPWWQHHIEENGEEPRIPAAPGTINEND
jgi:hypothetical protein